MGFVQNIVKNWGLFKFTQDLRKLGVETDLEKVCILRFTREKALGFLGFLGLKPILVRSTNCERESYKMAHKGIYKLMRTIVETAMASQAEMWKS